MQEQKEKVKVAIVTISELITENSSPDEALKYSQAVQNLTHSLLGMNDYKNDGGE